MTDIDTPQTAKQLPPGAVVGAGGPSSSALGRRQLLAAPGPGLGSPAVSPPRVSPPRSAAAVPHPGVRPCVFGARAADPRAMNRGRKVDFRGEHAKDAAAD